MSGSTNSNRTSSVRQLTGNNLGQLCASVDGVFVAAYRACGMWFVSYV